jgi:hypothetical protein
MEVTHFDWALHVARRRPLSGLLELLRNRLRQVEAEHAEFCTLAFAEPDATRVKQMCERDFTGSWLITNLDWNFDDALRTYAELGGKLTPVKSNGYWIN